MTLRVYREDTAGLDGSFDSLLAYAREFCCWGSGGIDSRPSDPCPACAELLAIEMMTEGMR